MDASNMDETPKIPPSIEALIKSINDCGANAFITGLGVSILGSNKGILIQGSTDSGYAKQLATAAIAQVEHALLLGPILNQIILC